MQTVKEEIKSLLQKLPDNCTFEDVQYHLYVLEKIRCGIERAEKDGPIDQKEIERRMSKWTMR
jgi:hypothetical protein